MDHPRPWVRFIWAHRTPNIRRFLRRRSTHPMISALQSHGERHLRRRSKPWTPPARLVPRACPHVTHEDGPSSLGRQHGTRPNELLGGPRSDAKPLGSSALSPPYFHPWLYLHRNGGARFTSGTVRVSRGTVALSPRDSVTAEPKAFTSRSPYALRWALGPFFRSTGSIDKLE